MTQTQNGPFLSGNARRSTVDGVAVFDGLVVQGPSVGAVIINANVVSGLETSDSLPEILIFVYGRFACVNCSC